MSLSASRMPLPPCASRNRDRWNTTTTRRLPGAGHAVAADGRQAGTPRPWPLCRVVGWLGAWEMCHVTICRNPVSFIHNDLHNPPLLLTLDRVPIDDARLQHPVQHHQHDDRRPLQLQRPGSRGPDTIADALLSLGRFGFGAAVASSAAPAPAQQLGRPQPHHRSAGSLPGLFKGSVGCLVRTFDESK